MAKVKTWTIMELRHAYEQGILALRAKRETQKSRDTSEDFPNPGKYDIMCDCKLCKEMWKP